MPDALKRQENGVEAKPDEVDPALLEFEQALHRREALIVITSRKGRAHSSLVRTALARFEDAFLVVIVSAASSEPVLALDRLLENSAEAGGNLSPEEKQAALERVAAHAGELGRPILIVIEDAEHATVAQIEKLRTALRIEQGRVRAIQLVLVGSQKLVRKLKKREASGIWTRVTTHIDVPPDAPSARAALDEEEEATDGRLIRRRSPLVAITSGAVLVAALLVIASIARREEPGTVVVTGLTTVQPARSVEATASPDSAPAANAGTPDAPAGAIPASGAVPVLPAATATGAVPSPAVAPTAAQPGPQVTQSMGVETVRGTVAHKNDAAVVPAEKGAPGGEAHPEAAAAEPQPAPQKPGARVLTVDTSGATPPVAPLAPTAPVLRSAPTAANVSASASTVAVPGSGTAAEAASNVSAPAPSSPVAPSAADTAAAASSPVAAAPAVVASAAPITAAPDSGTVAASDTTAKASPAANEPAAQETSATPDRAVPKTAALEGIELQVASLSSARKAESLKTALLGEFHDVRVDEAVVAGKPYFRVRVGPFASGAEAARAEERLKAMGHNPVRYGGAKRAG